MRPDPAGHVIDATSFLGRVVGRILRLWLLFLVIVYHVVLSLLPSRWADGVRSSRTKLADFMAELSVLFFVAPRASLADHLWFVASIVLRPLARTVGPYERRCFSRACRLDPPPYGATVRHVDTVAVGDGQVLRGTLWLPTGAGERFPTVIVRSPYGAQCTWIEWGQIILAERGYAVLLQDTRGRFGSDGMFVPIEQERDDGAATVAWVRQQPWCDGRVGVFGGSYLGLTAWAAVGASPPGAVQACVPVITQASIHSAIHGHGDAGGFSLELITYWFLLIDLVALAPTPLRLCVALLKALRDRPLTKAQGHTPLLELDEVLLGRQWPFYRDAISAPDADGPFWSERSTLCELRAGRPGAVVPPPLQPLSRWPDFFLPQALRDFEAAAAAQPDARLTVGPWDHWGQIRLLGQQHMLRAALGCLDANLRPAAPPRALPPLPTYDDGGRAAEEVGRAVQLCLVGSNRWVGLRAWPPPDAPPPTPQYLGSGGALRWEAAPVPPSRVEYTYDPARPTPSAGGPSFNPLNAGARSQRAIERRPDVWSSRRRRPPPPPPSSARCASSSAPAAPRRRSTSSAASASSAAPRSAAARSTSSRAPSASTAPPTATAPRSPSSSGPSPPRCPPARASASTCAPPPTRGGCATCATTPRSRSASSARARRPPSACGSTTTRAGCSSRSWRFDFILRSCDRQLR